MNDSEAELRNIRRELRALYKGMFGCVTLLQRVLAHKQDSVAVTEALVYQSDLLRAFEGEARASEFLDLVTDGKYSTMIEAKNAGLSSDEIVQLLKRKDSNDYDA